jgi:ribose transport system ATP-binding protein
MPDAGELAIDGEAHSFMAPRQARQSGIAIIYQEYSLAATLTVAENIFLGEELRVGPFTRRRAQEQRARQLLEQIGARTIDPRERVERLRGADQQAVEIAKALKTQPRLLLLDEPTASLTEAEIGGLMSHLRRLREQRLPIVYVTHRLGEVFEIADRVTVLRDGRVALSAPVASITRDELVEAIAGRRPDTLRAAPPELGPVRPGVPRLVVRELLAPGVGPVDLEVEEGEIVGLFGLVGSGRTELLEALFGARRLARGSLSLDGREQRFRRPADAIAAGLALVPSERLRNSLFSPLSGLENVLLPQLRTHALAGVIRRSGRERNAFTAMAERLRLRPVKPRLQAGRFSGGNQQKLVLARWLGNAGRVRVLLLDEPTQGVDVGARRDLYDAIEELVADTGCAVIFTSSDEEEVETLAHRALILSRGAVVSELRGPEINQRELLQRAHLGERKAS